MATGSGFMSSSSKTRRRVDEDLDDPDEDRADAEAFRDCRYGEGVEPAVFGVRDDMTCFCSGVAVVEEENMLGCVLENMLDGGGAEEVCVRTGGGGGGAEGIRL
jgi:hypothetical protein